MCSKPNSSNWCYMSKSTYRPNAKECATVWQKWRRGNTVATKNGTIINSYSKNQQCTCQPSTIPTCGHYHQTKAPTNSTTTISTATTNDTHESFLDDAFPTAMWSFTNDVAENALLPPAGPENQPTLPSQQPQLLLDTWVWLGNIHLTMMCMTLADGHV